MGGSAASRRDSRKAASARGVGFADTSWKEREVSPSLSRLISTAALRLVPPRSKKSAMALARSSPRAEAKASQILRSISVQGGSYAASSVLISIFCSRG